MIVCDLKMCEMYIYPNWREQVQDCSIWRGWIKEATEDVNKQMKTTDKSEKLIRMG